MTIRYINSNILVLSPGTDAVTANPDGTIIVEAGVTVGAQGGVLVNDLTYGIVGATGTGDVDVQVFGTVFGTHGGIFLDASGLSQSVFVGAAGRVHSEFNAINLRGSSLDIVNAGIIRSEASAIVLNAGFSAILNTGLIATVDTDAIIVTSGDVHLVNTGTIRSPYFYSFYDANPGNTTIWNSGLMFGNILLGDGNDLYQGGGQVLNGWIDGSAGNDTIIGGAGNETMLDLSGANWLAGGDGSDRISIGIGAGPLAVSHVFGGVIGGADTSANDTIELGLAAIGANIFLSAGAAVGQVTRVGDNAVAAFITGFENATGSVFADAIIGSSAANVIEGGNGGDWMVGNGGADRFVFADWNHADTGDQIRDFRRSEGDRIDLSEIYANVTSPTNGAFIFTTTRTSNAAGEAVVTNFGNSARVDLYTNADNTVDGTFVVVYGEAGVTNLQATDFIL